MGRGFTSSSVQNASGKSSLIDAVRWATDGFRGGEWQTGLGSRGGYPGCVTHGHDGEPIECRIVLRDALEDVRPAGVWLPTRVDDDKVAPGTELVDVSEPVVLRLTSSPSGGNLILTSPSNPDRTIASGQQLISEWKSTLDAQRYWRFGEALRKLDENTSLVGTETPFPDGRDVMAYIASLRLGHPTVWERVLAAIRAIVPETSIYHVIVPLGDQGQNADLRVLETDEREVMWKNAATGVKQVVFLVSLIVAAPPKSVIFVEEPESNLHPIAQRRFMGFVVNEAASQSKQIVLATHSLDMIDSPGWTKTFLLSKSEGLITPFEPKNVRKLVDRWSNLRSLLEQLAKRFS